jgi:hypothetical protein
MENNIKVSKSGLQVEGIEKSEGLNGQIESEIMDLVVSRYFS